MKKIILQDNGKCLICSHYCKIKNNRLGVCKKIKNINGILYSLNDGITIANPEPVEKKPLFHFMPGTMTYSVGAPGCNFRCLGCQNYELTKTGDITDVYKIDIIKNAKDNNCQSISYTYSDPSVFFDYIIETAEQAKNNKLKNIMITNGYLSKEALNIAGKYIDAMNIDLKFFNDISYRRYSGGVLKNVLNNIKKSYELGIHLEIAVLVISGLNSSDDELFSLFKFIADIDKNIPIHISRFKPFYKAIGKYKQTTDEDIQKAVDMANKNFLNFIYTESRHNDTICPECNSIIIKRDFLSVSDNLSVNGKCNKCKTNINIIGEKNV